MSIPIARYCFSCGEHIPYDAADDLCDDCQAEIEELAEEEDGHDYLTCDCLTCREIRRTEDGDRLYHERVDEGKA
jgi:hypothetical protein